MGEWGSRGGEGGQGQGAGGGWHRGSGWLTPSGIIQTVHTPMDMAGHENPAAVSNSPSTDRSVAMTWHGKVPEHLHRVPVDTPERS